MSPSTSRLHLWPALPGPAVEALRPRAGLLDQQHRLPCIHRRLRRQHRPRHANCLLQGICTAAPVANGGETVRVSIVFTRLASDSPKQISDILPPENRGTALSIYSLAPLLGPCIGPVIGGFLTEAKGWRWAFWVLAILAVFTTVASFVGLREMYPGVLLERKAARLRKETGSPVLLPLHRPAHQDAGEVAHCPIPGRLCGLRLWVPVPELQSALTRMALDGTPPRWSMYWA